MPVAAPARNKVFISYSHKDDAWLERLRVHLKPVDRAHGSIDIWHDKEIAPGSTWMDEITGGPHGLVIGPVAEADADDMLAGICQALTEVFAFPRDGVAIGSELVEA